MAQITAFPLARRRRLIDAVLRSGYAAHYRVRRELEQLRKWGVPESEIVRESARLWAKVEPELIALGFMREQA